MIHQRSPRLWLVFQVVFAIAVFAAAWYGGEPALGLACAALLLAGAGLFTYTSNRGWSLPGKLTGVGDERERSVYRAATYRTGEMLIYVLAIWGVISVAKGEDDTTLMLVLLIYAALWIGNFAWEGWRERRPLRPAR